MNVTRLEEYDDHNKVLIIDDKSTGLKGAIAIHRNGKFKHAFGATRIWAYPTEEDAVKDALKLSRIMSYKCALASLPYAGAKGVIIASTDINKKKEYLDKYLSYVNKLKGKFITGSDVGVSLCDVKEMRKNSDYIVGVKVDPVKYTADGIFNGIQVALKEVFGSEEINNKTFAIQGLGKIGVTLLSLLYQRGAIIYAADVNEVQTEFVKHAFPKVKIVSPEEIHKQKVDVYSPCALSNCINSITINELNCKIVLGGANSQLESDKMGIMLHEKGILYGPDYVVNAGGIIAVVDEFENERVSNKRIEEKVQKIKITLKNIFDESKKINEATSAVADQEAKKIIS